MTFITPTEHEKSEWARLARVAFKHNQNSIGYTYSVAAALPRDDQMRVDVFDNLQRKYRAWLIGGLSAFGFGDCVG